MPLAAEGNIFAPDTLLGASLIGAIAFALATVVVLLIRRSTRRIGQRLSDVTVLRFASMLVQMLVYLIALVLVAHMVPALRVFGTALLAGASVVSVVVGLAAQDTIGNLIAGLSLVLSKTIRVGDTIRLYCPVGTIQARVKIITLGFTVLVDEQGNEVVVPNNVMMGSAIVRVTHPPVDAAAGGGRG